MTDILTTIKAAKLTGVSEDTIRRLAATGVIPARKIGAAWAITPADLDAGLAVWRKTLQERAGVAATARWQKAETHMAGKLTLKQAAAQAGVSERSVWDWTRRHGLAHERVPGNGKGSAMRIAIDPADFEAFMATREERRNAKMAAARKTWANLSIDAASAPPVQHPHQMFSSQPTFGQVHGSTEGAMTFDAHPATCAAPQGVCANPGCGRSCALIGAYCLDCTWQGYGREPDIWPPATA